MIYAIRAGDGPIKIGYSAADPEGRLRTMQTGNPQELRLRALMAGTARLEREIHAHLTRAGSHIRGEWFKPDHATVEVCVLMQSGPEAMLKLVRPMPGMNVHQIAIRHGYVDPPLEAEAA